MGSPISTIVTNLFIEEFESEAISTAQIHQGFDFKKKYEFTKSGKPICVYCKRVGCIHAKYLKRQTDEGCTNNWEN